MTFNDTSGSLVQDIVTYVRRMIKSPSSQTITDAQIGDYINRFVTQDMAARIELFELKTQYTFLTSANIFEYQLPFYTDSNGNNIRIPVYQLLRQPIYCDGVEVGFFSSNDQFYKIFPELNNNETLATGNGTVGAYSLTFSASPVPRGFTDDNGRLTSFVFIYFVDSNNNTVFVQDDGKGNLVQVDSGNNIITLSGSPVLFGSVDYLKGTATVTFPEGSPVPSGNDINVISCPYSSGTPRAALFFNNVLKLYPVPDKSYKINIDAFLTPMQFLATTSAVPFAYMSKYIAYGSGLNIISDMSDDRLYAFYRPLFEEQERLVLRRTNRQNYTARIATIYSSQVTANPYLYTQS